MLKFTNLIFTFLVLVTLFFLSGCGNTSRSGDIAPVATLPPVAATEAPGETTIPSQPTAETPATPLSAEPTPAPAAGAGPVISFQLSGGIVGFCDELSIAGSGAYVLRTCRQDEITGTLEPADLELLTAWGQNLASFQLNFEDNPGGPDNLASHLVFEGQGSTEADEAQKQMIFDWVNGLLIRTRPQAVAPPTPEPLAVGPNGLCPDIARPAVIVIDYERPGGLTLIDPDSRAECDIQFNPPPSGRIITAAGHIFYPVLDQDAQTMTVWRLSPSGEQAPLPFTSVSLAEFGPFSFAVSGDGHKIAWAWAVPNFGVDPPLYQNELRVANSDGSNQVALLNQWAQERSYVEPVRFSPDQSTLFYAVQPDGLGGGIFSFNGRYNSLYSLPTAGGEPGLIFACPPENLICIGDISADGQALAYVQPGQGVVVLGSDGRPLSTLTPPSTDYIGSPIFGPTGNLAFVSASLIQASEQDLPRPNPGTISLVSPPYTGQPQTLFSDNRVTAAWEWLDENRLIYGAMADNGNIDTGLVIIDGRQLELSPGPAIAILR